MFNTARGYGFLKWALILQKVFFVDKKNQPKITGPKSLYNWDRVNFHSIDFDYCGKNEYNTHFENSEKRYSKAKTLKNTQQYHCFVPKNKNAIKCFFSKIIRTRLLHNLVLSMLIPEA